MPYTEITTERTDEYPLNCTGDAVVGDRVRWTEGVFTGSWRKPKFAGERTIEAEIVADSYGGEKQQHTFSLVVTAAEGVDAPKAGQRIRRKGRNLYRNDCWRKPWDDESARQAAADEKHRRGAVAREAREERRGEDGFGNPSWMA